jgi:diguanylate cyclase (GGDEF)-like protein
MRGGLYSSAAWVLGRVLDTLSLRVAMAVAAVTMLVLFYTMTYRRTRSVFCGWWCLALLSFVAGAAAFAFDGTALQVVTDPLGDVVVVGGAVCSWAAASSLRGHRPPVWQLVVGPVVVGVAGALGHPRTNAWPGGGVYLGVMAAIMALTAVEMWPTGETRTGSDGTAELWHRTMSVASGLFAVFTAARCVAFVTAGADSWVFTVPLGSQASTLVILVLLVCASAGMSSLSAEQQARSLRMRATSDGLTGLLNRNEFLRRALAELRRTRRAGEPATAMVADLDHFKSLNDTYGHRAGDDALRAFADACRAELRATDLVGRTGGEEFAFLLPGCAPAVAEGIAEAIQERVRDYGRRTGRGVTVSFGISGAVGAADDVDSVIELADRALYQAKAEGRDRAIRYQHPA